MPQQLAKTYGDTILRLNHTPFPSVCSEIIFYQSRNGWREARNISGEALPFL